MHTEHAASGAKGDADEHPDYQELLTARDKHIAALIAVSASSAAGVQAKAAVLKWRPLIEDSDHHQQIAVSLANDVSELGATRPLMPVIPVEITEARALVSRCKQGNRRWDILSDKVTAIEEADGIEAQYGRRPIPLISWRRYGAIGGSEIERARDEFIAAGIPAHVVRAEYLDAKKRERVLERAGEEWDHKVGLTELRKQVEDCRRETRAAWKALGKVPVTNIGDAVAIISLLRERMRTFDELSDDWEVAAFMNASRFLTRMAA